LNSGTHDPPKDLIERFEHFSALYYEPMSEPSHSVAAILLTGGASRRMGQDKSQLIMEGSTLAIRASSLLQRVVETAVEVGPGVSGLPSTREQPPGGGPLVAIAAGCRALRENGHAGSALVIHSVRRLTPRLLALRRTSASRPVGAAVRRSKDQRARGEGPWT
jgi:hypothetical protein